MEQVVGLPGVRAAKTVLHRMVTRGGWIPDILPGGKFISGGASRDPSNSVDVTRLQAGLLMGKISTVVNSLGTVGYYAPSVIDVTAGAIAAGATSLTVSAAGGAELLRRLTATGSITITGPTTAGGTVLSETVAMSAVSGAGVVTVGATVNGYVAGSFIQPTDGSQDPLTFLPNGWPIPVTDSTGTVQDVEFAELPIDCIVDPTLLLPVWPADAGLRDWIMNRLSRPGGGKFTFSSVY
jgi:hypothetical protein